MRMSAGEWGNRREKVGTWGEGGERGESKWGGGGESGERLGREYPTFCITILSPEYFGSFQGISFDITCEW